MNKAFDTFLWENYPKTDTPLGKTLLNKVNTAVDMIDDRTIVLDNTKATKVEVSTLFKEVSYDEQTGIITFTRKNGAVVTIDTPMEKIALNIYYDPVSEMLTLPLIDGTQMRVDLSRLITEYEFVDSDTIAFSIKPDGKVTAIVKEGSVEEKHLRPDYLSDIKIEESKAKESAISANNSAKYAESYTHGGTGIRSDEETDNAKFYKEQAKIYYDNLEQAGIVTGVKGDAETTYQTGNVNLTPANIGLGNVANERQYSANNPQLSVTGSSGSCTGNAATATALTSNAGSAAQPVYFSSGKPVACTAYASASVNYANSAGTATTATKATQDGGGNNIVNTYYPKTGGTVNGNVNIPNARWFTTRNKLGLETILLGMNSSNNIHMGDYNGADASPVYLHAYGATYNFLNESFVPGSNGRINLGDASHLWRTIHAKTGTINTSDRTKKHDIHAISEVYERLFLSLQPKSFMFDDGDRVHIGAISQDVEDAMKELGIEPEQFAGFCKDVRYEYTEFNEEDGTPVEASKVPCTDEDGNLIYDYALRYQEFIFLTIHMTQRLWEKTALLEKENLAIKERVEILEGKTN